MNERPQIVVRYNDDIVANRFEGDRDLLIEWVSAFVWDNFRGTGFDLSIKRVEGDLQFHEMVSTEGIPNSLRLTIAVQKRFDTRVREVA
jgi:hypothetical protein